MKTAFIDANVILRFLTGDPPDMARQATALFRRAERGEVTLRIDEITVAEVVWVFHSLYKYPAAQISATLLTFLAQDGLSVSDLAVSALALFSSRSIDFADALLAVRMQRAEETDLYSFDKHFDRIPWVRRLAPGGSSGTERAG